MTDEVTTDTNQEAPQPDAPPVENVVQPTPIHEVALEVIAGLWGRGHARRKRLEAAGYNFNSVNAEVKNIFNQ
jgi:hypothetical protein